MQLSIEEINQKLTELDLAWAVLGGHSLNRVFDQPNFDAGVDFIVELRDLADEHNHHPDVLLAYDKVEVTLTTHSEGGLTQKDFDLAKAIDQI